MATILGGIGTSHVPTIGGAYDRRKQDDPDWAPLFEGYEPVKRWLAQKKHDVLVFFYNDHATTFFFDHYPTFALGVSAEYPIADEGLGPRAVPPLKGHAGLARKDRADRDQRAPAPEPDPRALLEARAGGAPRGALLSRRHQGRHRRHGRPVASDERRARGIQQREVGHEVPRSHCARPEKAHRDAARRLHPPRRHRRGGGDHVARDARRAVAARKENPPELLPADDHRDGGGAVRGACAEGE